ncbi:Glycosyltransferase involved in cell wall bisynthesis [Halanaerobium congolense]|jgi:glycosyltransferase involved in cell wall biosynthesis|uniref:Glycosyltransferase involved in cell wall bisynthesis n=1 Tax=Halanaerobium congolense TaxID=54121 RepID=A0A1I0AM53_9FIRM|nr:glycosyltransferase family 4 protein [Halanaerobium congolense]PTX16246.1 glycosyltransferase involved in cell wall biosynthesis [Halanaerobium congolense]SDF46729.1 Glycosyltransferase involved in cell wall bisynthesis [Halanaerobium congolense]SDH51707.1 Glycosyltransferase involved in cell wall bisynthesis [Halanaerobium congolense]SES94819.1 Glycosyltransferase involved in cell wall bisynthesis [Halanaerobium congolense]SFP27370.1 Glycosyltransferase involved in cell wall bisynthesis [H
MNKLNILQINSAKNWGGGETHLKDLIIGLRDRGHKIFLTVRPQIANKFKELDINLKVLPLKNSIDFYSVFKLVQIIKKNEIDIIHVHNGKDYWLAFFVKFFCKDIKIVATRHIVKPIKNSFIHKIMLSKIDQFIAVSESVKKEMINSNNISKTKIEVIYNGINIKEYKNINIEYLYKEFDLKIDDFVIGIVGTISDNKNQNLFIDIVSDIEISNTRFFIVGEDNTIEQKYKKKLLDKLETKKITDKIVLTGYREDIKELMSLFDILIIPSKTEAFGLVAIEAMASETPVIANNIDGLEEIIQDNYNGFLINNNSVYKFRKVMMCLYNNKELYNNIVGNGICNVKNNFSFQKMTNEVEKVYINIISG